MRLSCAIFVTPHRFPLRSDGGVLTYILYGLLLQNVRHIVSRVISRDTSCSLIYLALCISYPQLSSLIFLTLRMYVYFPYHLLYYIN